jgi:DNA-binding transcriptional regulator GbsR (MarR family)
MSIDRLLRNSYISVMTEHTGGHARKPLPSAVEQFILRWGDMGGQWGVNRSVAQIHALLYLSEQPLAAEAISEALGIARSNVSNSLKELAGWKLIYRVPVLGDRRDHYEAETDLWQMATRIAQGRKEREIDPAVAALRDVMTLADGDSRVNKTVRGRLEAMHDFVSTMDIWYGQMLNVPPSALMKLVKMGARVVNLLGSLGGKKDGATPGKG